MAGHPIAWTPEARYITHDGQPPPPPYTMLVQPVSLPGPPPPPAPLAAGPPVSPRLFGLPPPPADAPPFAIPPPPQLAQPEIPPGMGYVYPTHTMMHIITNGVVPYETPFREFQFRITMVPCGISVNELVRSLNLGDGPYQQVGVSECIELGDGAWGKGVTVFKGTEAGMRSLESFGWDGARGDTQKPVWLAIHRA